MWRRSIRFFLYNPLVALGLLLVVSLGGAMLSPLRLGLPWQRSIAVDALPDLSENLHIIQTTWPGQAPTRIEEQINYPLSAHLLSVPGLRNVRGQAMFGLSFLYAIFEESVDFYTARARLTEQLASLPEELLPEGVRPQLGPTATSLGQVYMYILIGRDSLGRPAGGWSLEELRRYQDFELKQQLLSVKGVAEVASIGGYEKAFEVVIDPLRLQAQRVSVAEVAAALRNSDVEVGAHTFELNEVEYTLQGLARIQKLSDVEEVLVVSRAGTAVRIRDVARVQARAQLRRALLDYEGAEAVGGIVTMQYGEDAMSVLAGIHQKVKEISPSLPKKRDREGRSSQLHILPYYDRSELIEETLGTLREALVLEILITLLVMLWMLRSLRAALMIAGLLPFSILSTFFCMFLLGLKAHVISLAGIAIAIGTVVDMGILLWDNVQRKAKEATSRSSRETVLAATLELAPALCTAMGSTLLSFLPVFALEASEGRLFHPLAWTKTFVLAAAFLLSLYVLPTVFAFFLNKEFSLRPLFKRLISYLALAGLLIGLGVWTYSSFWGSFCMVVGLAEWLRLYASRLSGHHRKWMLRSNTGLYFAWLLWVFSQKWLPLGTEGGSWGNLLVTAGICLGVLLMFWLLLRNYEQLFYCFWRNRVYVLGGCLLFLLMGLLAWRGGKEVAGSGQLGHKLSKYFPGLPRKFMPPLEEGSFLLMPIGASHAGLSLHKKNIQSLDKTIAALPEVSEVVGKLGRAETALDPAPMHMYEIMVNYKPEYIQDKDGRPLRFAVERSEFLRDSSGALVPDLRGEFYRNWRPHIRSVDDIWKEVEQLQPPTISRAPMLQPIETRRLMLQTGMRAKLGLKVQGQSLDSISAYAEKAGPLLRQVKGIVASSIYVEPLVGKPYLQLRIRRSSAQRFGLRAEALSSYIQTAIGGSTLATLQSGRIRWPLLLRYGNEARETPEALAELPVRTPSGAYVPLGELVEIAYTPGPQMIRSENSWPHTFVLFDIEKGSSAPEVVSEAEQLLRKQAEEGKLPVPAGVSYAFDGTYKETLRAEQRFGWIIPMTLLLIWGLLYICFKKIWLTLLLFGGLIMSFAAGFLCLWLYQQLEGTDTRILTQLLGMGKEVSLNTAVWVGFVALFGIATDNGVMMLLRLTQLFSKQKPRSSSARLQLAVEAGKTRVRACLTTTATTLLALLPLLSEAGKGAAMIQALALPLFGGVLLSPLLLFLLPLLYCLIYRTK